MKLKKIKTVFLFGMPGFGFFGKTRPDALTVSNFKLCWDELTGLILRIFNRRQLSLQTRFGFLERISNCERNDVIAPKPGVL